MGLRFETMREAMVASQLRPTGVEDVRLLTAMLAVPRERFVPAIRAAVAYADAPVPLGHGRTLNSPMVVGRLIDALEVAPGERVLVLAAGTGYSAAVLAAMGAQVIAVEPVPELAAAARANVPGAEVVETELAEAPTGPFDAVLIDGAVEELPQRIIDRLAPLGRLACGLLEQGTTRLARGQRGRAGFALIPFADADVAPLPEFARPKSFVF